MTEPDRMAPWPSHATIPVATELSGISRSALYRAAGNGQIIMRKLGKSVLVDMASVRDFLNTLPIAQIAPPTDSRRKP